MIVVEVSVFDTFDGLPVALGIVAITRLVGEDAVLCPTSFTAITLN